MARLNKKETSVNLNAAAAATARRKTVAAPRKRAAVAGAASDVELQETAVIAAPDNETTAEIVVAAVEYEGATELTPTQEEIAALAYSYWAERGYTEGSPELDWLRAEAELRQRALATA